MSTSRHLTPTKLFGACAVALSALVLSACGGGSSDVTPAVAPTTSTALSASLAGEQEPAPTATGALGTGSLTLTLPSRSVAGSISLNGMTATVAHIHIGTVGVNGPIIAGLTESAPGSGVWNVPTGTMLSAEQATAFTDGGLYFNAHSVENPTGEIRGQIGRQVSGASMSGAQEIPANASTASGTGLFSLDPATKKFTARMTLTGMTASVAHIHAGAVGVNGGVLFPLNETVAGSGVWVSAVDAMLTDAQLVLLNEGGLYFNAHSAAFPGGEIRGQIGQLVRLASMNSAQEVPTNASTATGQGALTVNPSTRAANGSIILTGMTAARAHIHIGAPGVNGPIIVELTDAGGGRWNVPANTVLTAAQVKAFKQGNLYFNAHSTAFPGGEIRGQIR